MCIYVLTEEASFKNDLYNAIDMLPATHFQYSFISNNYAKTIYKQYETDLLETCLQKKIRLFGVWY